MKHLGIHVFHQNSNLNWELENISFNLLSALSWRRYMGPLHLYCNKEYYETIQKWGLDRLYNQIDTDVLTNKPSDINYEDYWAYYKFLVIKKLKNNTPFTLLDTDLWLNKTLQIDRNLSCMMYHMENFDLEFEDNPYPDFDTLVPYTIREMMFDKDIYPTNCALLHIEDNSFIDEWMELSDQIIKYNQDRKLNSKSIKMCFIEQRLLPMLLDKMNKKYSTFIKPIYQSHLAHLQNGTEWEPHPHDLDLDERVEFESIKHVWGLKKFMDNDILRKVIMRYVISSLQDYSHDFTSYTKLIEELKNNYKVQDTELEEDQNYND